MNNIKIKWHSSIQEIPKIIWNNFLNENSTPFYKWDWLNALEKSNSVSAKYGWQPLFLSAWCEKNLIACAPLYLKSHSYGEFIFDNAFVQLAQSMGLQYYPKLIGMSPFSPVEGYRFLISINEDQQEITNIMMNIIDEFAIKNNILSCNFLYVDTKWAQFAEGANCAKWINHTSIWTANSQKTFEEYLASFNSNQRRNIRRERKSIENAGLKISTITGNKINQKIMLRMYDFYENHCAKWGPWGSKYLTKSFFEELSSDQNKEKIVLFSAYRENVEEPIAMSLCITNKKMLWGRYWGAKEKINSLHFELCYYSPIAWALENNLATFDPGAGGSHKLRRGFQAKPNKSMHRWYNKNMDQLIRNWLPHSNKLMQEEINAINNELPFRAKLSSI